MKRLRQLLFRILTHRHLPWLAALLAMLLCAPSLDSGWVLDDRYHQAALVKPPQLPELHRSVPELFAFHGERWTLNSGTMPWWTQEDLRLAFWRPLTGLSHGLDYRLWPEQAWLMHLHSILWLGAAVLGAGLFLRRVFGPEGAWAGGLAILLFALDGAHATGAMWIANRNAVISAACGFACLLVYDRRRRDGWRPGIWLAPFLLLMSVFAGETGVACGGYLLAYALCLDRGPWKERLGALLPCAALGVVWSLVYKLLGYGAHASTVYVDPVSQPLRFVGAVAERLPLLLWGQWAFPPADFYTWLSLAQRPAMGWMALAFSAAMALLLSPLLRRDPRGRFCALGMGLALLPACATFPSNRLLFFVGLGGAGLLALLLAAVLSGGGSGAGGRRSGRSSGRLWHWPAAPASAVLLLVNLVLSPVVLVAAATQFELLADLLDAPSADLELDDSIAEQRLVIVNAPSVIFSGYFEVARAVEGKPVPRHVLTLATGLYGIELERRDARTLALRPAGGFLLPPGAAPDGREAWSMDMRHAFVIFDTLFRDSSRPFELGERFDRDGVEIEVSELRADGRPAEVVFRFPEPLEAPTTRWIRWHTGAFESFVLPAPGESLTLAPVDFRVDSRALGSGVSESPR